MMSLPWKAFWDAGIASQKVYTEALNRELELLRATQQRFGKSCQDIAACRKPQDMMTIQSSLLSEMCEVASAQAKVASETVEQLRGCYTAAAQEAVEARKA
ncbi:phasin family protein [Humitalea rosea]|nr:phasin family protein [Humitalea rosea]